MKRAAAARPRLCGDQPPPEAACVSAIADLMQGPYQSFRLSHVLTFHDFIISCARRIGE
jgi:hypothetical protein